MYVCFAGFCQLRGNHEALHIRPQPSVPASRANKTMNFLNCFFVKRVAYFAQNIHFNGCNFLNNSPIFTCTLLLRWLPSCWTYKFSLVRTIVHVYCFPWPRVQLSFVHTTCTYKRNVGRTNSYLVRTIVHVYCFPWPRVQPSFVRTACTYKGMLVRTNS